MGWPWSSSCNSQAAELPEDHRHLDTMERQVAAIQYCSCMGWILPSANSPPVTEHHHQNLTLSGPYTATARFPKHIPAQSNHRSELFLVKNQLWKRSVKQKLSQMRRFLFCFVKVEKQAWLAQSFMYPSSHKRKMKEQHEQTSARCPCILMV